MDITFLLGNGFDIGLGLNTRYEDFYDEYCQAKEDDEAHILAFKNVLSARNKDEKKKIIDWADFEKAFGEYSTEFKIQQKREYLACFEDFVKCFNAYLEKENKKPDFSKENEIGKMMETAVTTYYHIRKSDHERIQKTYSSMSADRRFNFISFNYTNCVDKCASALKKNFSRTSYELGSVVHIHGYNEANMIMGVNDASQIANEEFASDPEVLAELVKPTQNIEMRMNYDRDATNLINRSHAICIYGMSIGETDKKWWKLICNWLAGNNARVLIILVHNENVNVRFPFEYKRERDKIVQKLLDYSNQAENVKNEISTRVFVQFNYDVFAMKLCSEVDTVHPSVKKIDSSMMFYGDVPPEESGLPHKEGQIYFQRLPEPAVATDQGGEPDKVYQEAIDYVNEHNEERPEMVVV